jgi:SAM-dependent methyltransferase
MITMSINQTNQYDFDRHIAEIYDRVENGLEDFNLIRRLIGPQKSLRILEPFCGTGRLVIPLAQDGHTVCGMDQSLAMLDHARSKIALLEPSVRDRITLIHADVLSGEWPAGFDVVILGFNCFYELASAAEQRHCIQFASHALKPDGHLYIDNDHMEGDLDVSWQVKGRLKSPLAGICADGTQVENTLEPIWFDVPNRLVKFHRTVRITTPEGIILEKEYTQQKHPISTDEVIKWLDEFGFTIQDHLGTYTGDPYSADARRSIFWARLTDSAK